MDLRALLAELRASEAAVPPWKEAWPRKDVAAVSAADLQERLVLLEERHAALMAAAAAEIAELRSRLQEAHAQLAEQAVQKHLDGEDGVAKDMCMPAPVQASRSERALPQQLLLKWMSLATPLRAVFRAWARRRSPRYSRLAAAWAEGLSQGAVRHAWRCWQLALTEAKRAAALAERQRAWEMDVELARLRPIPRALLSAWRDASEEQLLGHYLRLWREQASDAAKARFGSELLALRSGKEAAARRALRAEASVEGLGRRAFRVTVRHRLGKLLLRWRHQAAKAAANRTAFDVGQRHAAARRARKALLAWRSIGLQRRAEESSRLCEVQSKRLLQLLRTTEAVREYNQRMVKMAVMEVWCQSLPGTSSARAKHRSGAGPRLFT